jgi:hypothetical protein
MVLYSLGMDAITDERLKKLPRTGEMLPIYEMCERHLLFSALLPNPKHVCICQCGALQEEETSVTE